ncbi:MAG TPA: efflux RND transporter periplasmic adaptor subunit [Candidatus Angelobacter sp.]|nr:efflux RND transporter periplasmic adaptor subunit [Candidatus Angelobacter sp.]
MLKKMTLMLAIVVALIASLGFVKFKQIEAATQNFAKFQPPPTAVTTVVARQEDWPATLNAIGTVVAVQGVTVSADLPGIVDRIAFDSGKSVREGDVLVELDTRQERAQLAAAQAQSDLARVNFERLRGLVKDGVIPQADYDRAESEQRATEAKVKEIQATIARKTIRAPFSGTLGIRQVNLGQYLSAGNAVVPLQSLHPIYVNFGVPQEAARQVMVGRNVRITADDLPGRNFEGRVTAIDSVLDEKTRNVQVQATVANGDNKLHPGMFVKAQLSMGAARPTVTLPASAISYAPYGDSVFVVSDMQDQSGHTYRGVRQQFVKVEGSRGDQVAVTSGVKGGDEVVSSGVFKLRNSAAVQVNNKVQPENNPAPKPEDN